MDERNIQPLASGTPTRRETSADRPGLGSALISVNIFASAGIGSLVFAAGTFMTGYSGTAILSAITGLSGVTLLGLLQRRRAH